MLHVLYNIIIEPLVLIYDIIFVLLYSMIEHPVFSIIALSIVINLLCVPLYWKADAIQRSDIEKQKKMKPWIDHIRKHFSGDERFMMQSAYYKVEEYNPLFVLKEAGPIALQIPFFTAAYRYISSITFLKTATFGPITNLLAPDGLLSIGGFTINILPILMTLINWGSCYIYTKDRSLRLKIQGYGTALVFLVLLYNSPSGLVIYWIMNNLFSLGKNIYFRYSDKLGKALPLITAVLMVILVSFGTVIGKIDTPRDVFISECIMVVSICTLIKGILREYKVQIPEFIMRPFHALGRKDNRLLLAQVIMAGFCCALLMGFYIPSTVLSSSVAEFMDKSTGTFRYELLTYPLAVYSGLFVLWMSVIIFSRDGSKRNLLAVFFWVFFGVAIINQFLFDPHIGILYSDLVFDGGLWFSNKQRILNNLACLAGGIVFALVFIKRPKWMLRIGAVTILAFLLIGANNVHTIETAKVDFSPGEEIPIEQQKGLIKLSRSEKNVVVLMLDREIGGYVPYIFDEIPELKDIYEGFVYYPNTVSHGGYTNFGTPGLFGGYEYTPAEMNKRTEALLKDKHNEAMTLMPMLFSENGYDVYVTDPPYAGYGYTPDLSIYDGIENVSAYNLIGKFTDRFNMILDTDVYTRQRRNFTIYSLFRTVPLFMKDYVYDNGRYISINGFNSMTGSFIDCYSTLEMLPEITAFVDGDTGCFLMMQNSLPHQPTPLNPPQYLFDGSPTDKYYNYGNKTVDGKTMIIDEDWEWNHYCVNAASLQLVGKWLNAMKEYGVYDNTRIILVADHGRDLGQFEDMIHPDGLDVEFVWPMLMVKDFNSSKPFSTSMEFMTNADVPSLAMKGIIENPVNPYTGNAINSEMKENVLVTDSNNWTLQQEDTTFDTSDGNWWTVHDSIFDMKNWTKLEN